MVGLLANIRGGVTAVVVGSVPLYVVQGPHYHLEDGDDQVAHSEGALAGIVVMFPPSSGGARLSMWEN